MNIRPLKRFSGLNPTKIIITIAAALLAVPSMAAETKFSGELKPEVMFNIPGDDGYTGTPLNPNNEWGIDDLMFRNQIDLKVESSGETAAMDLWFQVNQYPMADLLVGSAALLADRGDPAGLRAAVTSPGGTTAAGLEVLDGADIDGIFTAAVAAAAARGAELGRAAQG